MKLMKRSSKEFRNNRIFLAGKRKFMRTFFLLILCAAPFAGISQDHQKEINEQLWKPFLKASNEFEGDTFLSFNSKDLTRIAIDQKIIEDYDQYAKGILPNFKRLKEEGKVSRKAEMRFTTRISIADKAYETGYFKSVTKLANGEIRTRYSQFYMVLRKENGYWKIFVDSDTNGGDSITEEMFLKAQPLE